VAPLFCGTLQYNPLQFFAHENIKNNVFNNNNNKAFIPQQVGVG
jgi:hypothetical protein